MSTCRSTIRKFNRKEGQACFGHATHVHLTQVVASNCKQTADFLKYVNNTVVILKTSFNFGKM